MPVRKKDDIDLLWSVLPHPPGSVVRLFARGGDVRDGDYARSAAEIRRFARAFPDRNIYVAPNPTNSSTAHARHAAADVTHWSYFLIDMDPVHESCDPQAALEEALLWLGEWTGRNFTATGRLSVRPIVIDSGRGCQAWIRLDDHPLYTVEKGKVPGATWPLVERSIARRVNGHWLKRLDERLKVTHGCRIDTSVSDLPRVMRCPGTRNLKTGRVATFLNATDHVFGGFAHILTTGTPPEALEDPEPPQGVEAGQPWQMVFVHLTRMAQTYLTQGQEEPGRHKVMWHTAKKLQELGVSRDEAARALRWANRLKGKDEALPADQITHALDTAYQK